MVFWREDKKIYEFCIKLCHFVGVNAQQIMCPFANIKVYVNLQSVLKWQKRNIIQSIIIMDILLDNC